MEPNPKRLQSAEDAGNVQPQAAPESSPSEAKNATSGQRGLFGQTIIEPQRVEQLPLFHEPVSVPGPKRNAVDERIARKFDESATPQLWEGREPVEQQAAKLFAKWAELDVIIFRPKAPAANARAIHRDGTARTVPRYTVQDYLRRMIVQGKRCGVADEQEGKP